MSHRFVAAAAGLLLLPVAAAFAGSATTKERVDLVEQDLRDTQAHVVQLMERLDALEKENRDLRAGLGLDKPSQRITPADLAARISSLETDLHVLFENQNESNRKVSILADRVDAVFRQVQSFARASAPPPPEAPSGLVSEEAAHAETEEVAPRESGVDSGAPIGSVSPTAAASAGRAPIPPASDPVQPGGAALVDPDEVYQAARADFARGSFDLAESGFGEFLESFPDSEFADNALYWMGECRYARGDFAGSVESFDSVVARWPAGDKAPDAGYKKGLALLELNRTAEGIVQLQKVKDSWPGTPAGRLAKGKLQSLGLL